MWFKINRREFSGLGCQPPTPVKAITKSKKCLKRFHWLSLHRSVRQRPCPAVSPLRHSSALPPPPTDAPTVDAAFSPARRIRCGTTIIPIMRASALHLPSPAAVKRRTTASSSSSMDYKQLKIQRLSRRMEHFNPIYDDVYGDFVEEIEDEDIYEEIAPLRKRALVAPSSYLDLMQVSAVVCDSPRKRFRPLSPTPPQDVYALHGGDWVSVASGIYDAVASSSDSEFDEEFDIDAGFNDWAVGATGNEQKIPWPTAAYGKSALVEDSSELRWMRRESYVVY